MQNLSGSFLLDPDVAYLNHGAFGATPEPVFREYQRWQRELELQPTEFLGRRHNDLMRSAREALGDLVGARPQDLVFTQNVTQALNIVARSLKLGPGDELLTTDHEYGACERMWRFLSAKRGFVIVRRRVTVPFTTQQALVDDFMDGVTSRTRAIFISHITSPTAAVLPVAEICRRARLASIPTVVDGAHAPGQLELNLASIGADFYGANLHKWLCAPKGAGFLHASESVQPMLEPLVVSWGYEPDQPGDSPFIDFHEWWGTRDVAAFLAVPAAIEFQRQHNWAEVRARCHQRLGDALAAIVKLTGMNAFYPDDSWYGQMASAPLPWDTDVELLHAQLYNEHRVEVPILAWNEWKLLRLSIQAYNSDQDIARLLRGLQQLL